MWLYVYSRDGRDSVRNTTQSSIGVKTAVEFVTSKAQQLYPKSPPHSLSYPATLHANKPETGLIKIKSDNCNLEKNAIVCTQTNRTNPEFRLS